MTRACWTAAPDGAYWIDLAIATMPLRIVLDTGLTDPAGQIAFDLQAAAFDALDQSGQLLKAGYSRRRDASGRRVRLPIGFVAAQLIEPATGTPFSPRVRCLAVRNPAGVPSRVGIVFFHGLSRCRADWDFDNHLWCIECP